MKKHVYLLTTAQVIKINKLIVAAQRQQHVCLNKDKIESALAVAFYPGDCIGVRPDPNVP